MGNKKKCLRVSVSRNFLITGKINKADVEKKKLRLQIIASVLVTLFKKKPERIDQKAYHITVGNHPNF